MASGWASAMGREQTRIDNLHGGCLSLAVSAVLLCILVVRVHRTWTTSAVARKSTQSGASTALTLRRTHRPWPVSTQKVDGTLFHGRALRVRCRVFWLFLTITTL